MYQSKTVKSAENNPRPSGDLIPNNVQSRHAPEQTTAGGISYLLCIQSQLNH